MNWEKDVYEYWFSECGDVPTSKQNRRWFMGGDVVDNEVKSRFWSIAELYEANYDNSFDLYKLVDVSLEYIEENLIEWKKIFLGRIIMGDQIFRHIYRNEVYSYHWERPNRNVVMKLMSKLEWNDERLVKNFSLAEILFLMLPLVHYEPGRGNRPDFYVKKIYYFEIEKVLAVWKNILKNETDDNRIRFVNKAIHNVKKHYEELKMNKGCYPNRNKFYYKNIIPNIIYNYQVDNETLVKDEEELGQVEEWL